MNLTSVAARTVAVTLGLLTLGTAAAFAQEPNTKRTIVVFGGFGYFDDAQHQWLQGLIRRGADQRSKYSVEGRRLEEEVTRAAQTALASRDGKERREGALTRWTNHSVVFGASDLADAFTRATGERPVGAADMFAEFDRTYIVVLSSGFEHHSVLRTAHENGATYHAYASVSVSASLVDLGSGDILLSASALGEHDVTRLSARDEDNSDVWAARYAAAYGGAASRALILLRRLADRSDVKDLDRALDTYMVTGATVQKLTGPMESASRDAARLFDWKLADSIGDFCAPVNQCAPDSKACAAMTGFLVSGVSQALSQAGHKVLPPLTWRTGTRTTGDIVRYKLNLPNSQVAGLPASADLVFNPRRATYKAVATLAGVTLRSSPEKNNVRTTDVYSAMVNGWIARTDPDTCASRPEDQRLLDSKGAGLGMKDDLRPTKEPPIDDDSRRLLYLRAMHDAAVKISVSLGGR